MRHRAMTIFLIACVLMASKDARADITISGPDTAIAGTYATYTITGLPPEKLARAKVTCEPSEGVSLLPATTWGGQPILMFMTPTDGEYEITISLNAFVRSFVVAQDEAQAAGVAEETLALYRQLHTALVTDYPLDRATKKIKVGENPTPIPTPDKVQLLIVEETGQRRPPYGDLFIQLRRSATLKGVDIWIVDKDGKTPDGGKLPNVSTYIDNIEHPLPVLFVIAETSEKKGKAVWQGTCPSTFTEFLAVVGKYRKVD